MIVIRKLIWLDWYFRKDYRSKRGEFGLEGIGFGYNEMS